MVVARLSFVTAAVQVARHIHSEEPEAYAYQEGDAEHDREEDHVSILSSPSARIASMDLRHATRRFAILGHSP